MTTPPGTRPDGRGSGAPGARGSGGSGGSGSGGPGPVGGGRARRRVVDDSAPPRFFVSDLDGAPRWVGGLLAGLQAALLSLLVVVLPAVAAYVATSAAPATSGIPWTRAVEVGAGLWLLAHGVPLTDAPSVTLVPLGLTALALFGCYASARRSGYATRSAFGAGVGAYVGVLLVVGLATGVPLLHVGIGLLAGAVVASLGLGAGLLRRPEAPRFRDVVEPVRSRLPEPVAHGVAAGTTALATLVLLAAVLATLWVVAGRGAIADVVASLRLDAVGGIVLAVAELAYAPTLVLWALAWLAGPGFAVGTGTSFAVGEVQAGAVPAVPLLGALPAPDVTGGVLLAVPVVTLLAGAASAAVLRRRLVTERALDAPVAGLVSAAVAGLGTLVLAALSRGGIGPGRMTELGPQPVLVALAVAAGVALGSLLVLLPGDRHVRAAVAGAVRRAWAAVTGAARRG
ncbi:cell division protein PerM [Cellulomonas pakistanensis]|uniref:Uncharacterized protein n=1 Tax=Cellulomonas pakistanensis TaxID=992287 RepID=A0A919U1U5_9CELL|nr:DUF6350 family protein [Cellulomonas pakistanensis]GIG35288.1 hypothetical protein Cpa01nite_06690 [Cellulomonas pakistanensis]